MIGALPLATGELARKWVGGWLVDAPGWRLLQTTMKRLQSAAEGRLVGDEKKYVEELVPTYPPSYASTRGCLADQG